METDRIRCGDLRQVVLVFEYGDRGWLQSLVGKVYFLDNAVEADGLRRLLDIGLDLLRFLRTVLCRRVHNIGYEALEM